MSAFVRSMHIHTKQSRASCAHSGTNVLFCWISCSDWEE